MSNRGRRRGTRRCKRMRRAGVREREQRVVASGLSDRAAIEAATVTTTRSKVTRGGRRRRERRMNRRPCFVGGAPALWDRTRRSRRIGRLLYGLLLLCSRNRSSSVTHVITDCFLFPSPSGAPFVSFSDSAKAVSLTASLLSPFRPSAAALSSALRFLLSLPSLPFVRSAPRRW